MILKELILALLLQHTPVGKTIFSVEALPECGTDQKTPTCEIKPVCAPATEPLCAAPWWSESHGAWVRYETKETAAKRLTVVADAMAAKTMQEMCVDNFGHHLPKCTPLHWGWNGHANTGTIRELALAEVTAMIMESGAREDVQMGRGRYRRPVDHGQGRGPGNEACFFQVLPDAGYRYADWISEADRVKIAIDPRAKEALLKGLLGTDELSLSRCASIGIKMLAISRNICGTKNFPDVKIGGDNTYWWASGMFSYYGVGPNGKNGGCYDENGGKTLVRVRLLQKLLRTAPALTWDIAEQASNN